MAEIIVTTQAELDIAIAAAVEHETTIILEGDGVFKITTVGESVGCQCEGMEFTACKNIP